jgi:hypothetical protein
MRTRDRRPNQENLAETDETLARIDEEAGNLAAAAEGYRRATIVVERLASDHPEIPSLHLKRSSLVQRAGLILARSGRNAAAVAELRRCLAIQKRHSDGTAVDQNNIAYTYARLAGLAGRPESGLTPDDGNAEAGHALETLRVAVASGFTNFRHILADSDLAVLRSRPDFPDFLADRIFRHEVFAP